ncbi:probable disease resistance protein At1g15890 [Selaginella moellendorffii]|nr:probable disease resistance protein At1g15890 [Selaginella moellendorffii]|eukprot:XP_024523009.1 probable disease resistance protein At1g15890 [Selaginella moellendorffii]
MEFASCVAVPLARMGIDALQKVWCWDANLGVLEHRAANINAKIDAFDAPKHTNPGFKFSDAAEECLDRIKAWNHKAQELLVARRNIWNPKVRYERYGAIDEAIRLYDDLLSQIESYERELELVKRSSSYAVRTSPHDKGVARTYVRRVVPETIFGGVMLDEVVKILLADNSHDMCVGVLGMGGCGKTTLASCVHNDPRIREYFQDNIVWFTVAKDACEDSLKSQVIHALEWGDKLDMVKACNKLEDMKHFAREVCGGRKVLLILDDVWQANLARNFIDFVDQKSSSRVLVTTRKEDVIKKLQARVIKVRLLPEGESKEMFWRFAFGPRSGSGSSHKFEDRHRVEKVAERIARKCEGLPLALEVVGSAMAVYRDHGSRVWKERYRQLHLSNDDDLEKLMFKRLKFSYDELGNNDDKLQECFLYVAAFPEDARIDFEDLIKCWIASNSQLSFKEIAKELDRRSMIKVVNDADDNPLYITVHDMLRKLCIRVLKGKFHSQAQHEEKCFFGHEWKPGMDERANKVSFISKNVRSLPSNLSVRDMVLLDGNNRFSVLDEDLIDRIKELKGLSLKGTKVEFIPPGISKLTRLEMLDLRNTWINHIPVEIMEIESLQYLKCDSKVRNFGFDMLYKLSNLKELTIHASDTEVVDLTGISSATHLRYLEMIGSSSGLIILSEGFTALEHLETLFLVSRNIEFRRVSAGSGRFKELMRCHISCKSSRGARWSSLFKGSLNLQVFRITGVEEDETHDEGFTWIEKCHGLRVFDLYNHKIKNLSRLHRLKRLEELHLICDGVACQQLAPPGSFPNLKELKLDSFPESLQLDPNFITSSAMENLKTLHLSFATPRDHLPLFVTSLPSLKFLTVEGYMRSLVSTTITSFPSSLQELHLYSYEQLPDDFFAIQAKLITVQCLLLSSQQGKDRGNWQKIPASISLLPCVSSLDTDVGHASRP